MKSLRIARAFGAAFGLVMLGAVAMATVSNVWNNVTPSSTGPWLGDSTINLGSLWTAYTNGDGLSYHSGLSVSQTAAQANCTQLDSSPFQEIATSAGAGYVCLPTAIAGSYTVIGNSTGQTVNIYSSATSYTRGTPDTINTVAGTTAYTALTTHISAKCYAVANGAWFCGSN